MTSPAEDYVPVDERRGIRKKALRTWAIALAVVFVWTLLIVAAPVAKANGIPGISAPLYKFFGFICHQLPDRSFHAAGESFAVCSRCFGVYFGILLGFVVYPLWRNIEDIEPLPRFWLFLSLIPISIDWSLTFLEIWENTQLSRVVTGAILGFACATFIIPALSEITRNLVMRKRPR